MSSLTYHFTSLRLLPRGGGDATGNNVGPPLATTESDVRILQQLRGDQIEVFKILNGYENIDSNICFEIKESKITRGHNYTLVEETKVDVDVRKYSFSQRTILCMATINVSLTVYMLVVLICSRTK